MRGIKFKFCISIILLFFMVNLQSINNIIYAEDNFSKFSPTPNEDKELGRNTHVYLALIEGPSANEQESFIDEISRYAVKANEKWGIPAAAIIGMAALESGYGTTRIAYYANNLFGIKVWGGDSSNAWQLKGQPDEDFDREIPILVDLGEDRIVFDESERRDNWYRKFDSYGEAVKFLAGTLLINDRYVFARDAYEQRLKDGWSDEKATEEFLYDIANAGYNHLGGSYYRESVSKLIDRWDLLSFHSGETKIGKIEEESIDTESAEDIVDEVRSTSLHEMGLEKLQKKSNIVLLSQESIELKIDEVPPFPNVIFQKIQHVFTKVIQFFH